jgi:adenylate cyclase
MQPDEDAETRRAALAEVRQFLLRQGVTENEIAAAVNDDHLDILVADRLLLPSRERYDEVEVSEITGIPLELAQRFWRALGFPDPRPGEKVFTDVDIEAIRDVLSMVELGVGDIDTFLQLARVVGSSMARIADAEISPTALTPLAIVGASHDSVLSAQRLVRVADTMLPATAHLLEFVWRRHVQAAIRRTVLLRSRGGDSLPELCIGFADMVGFTMLSQQLSEDELAAVVSRFETLAHDVVTGREGRVVKMIGDEVMFVTESTLRAADIALALAEAYTDDDLLSDVRVALALGPVLLQDGDYYGPVVNLANRLVAMTRPGSVLITDHFHDALLADLSKAEGREGPETQFAFSRLRPRNVKDVGRVQLWSLRRPGEKGSSLDARLGKRWERLSEVLKDLDELRDRGERLITGGLRAAGAADGDSGRSGAAGRPGSAGSAESGAAESGDAVGTEGERTVERPEGPAS